MDDRVFRAGVDVGSTTVKTVVLDRSGKIVFSSYLRHKSDTVGALIGMIKESREELGDIRLTVSLTGSGAVALGRTLCLPFVQEVIAMASAAERIIPLAEVAIELGGEDAKLLFLRPSFDARMNGVCAGGTGAFIDQIASLMHTDAEGLDLAARDSSQVYPIAARCGVFAKTDVQSLINTGVPESDIAASVFRAVVIQTISGLACGRPIRGKVAFLGGPLHFLPELRRSFVDYLGLSPDDVIFPPDSHLFAAVGAAFESTQNVDLSFDELLDKLLSVSSKLDKTVSLPPLFDSIADYNDFVDRHKRSEVPKRDLSSYKGKCFLGVDAGSTTMKLALVGENGELLFSFYSSNNGKPIDTALKGLKLLADSLPPEAVIARSCSTGYGERLLKTAFSLDEGVVETVAHAVAAEYFDPAADSVLDIGGQDMKYIRLKNGEVDSIILNEACSSGCGSFIENFASSLGYSAAGFAEAALFAPAPVDLGVRCTVFMNSNVKQAQQNGASVPDIAAGLSYSVVKNALYKVIKIKDASFAGRRIVVQGGTFYNIAVLRAFELESGKNVVCPDIAGIMGAFGAALTARSNYDGRSGGSLDINKILSLSYHTDSVRCGRCSNDCVLTVVSFPGGRRHISGNRCERFIGDQSSSMPGINMYAVKRDIVFGFKSLSSDEATKGIIGIPRVLNMFENYPFWAAFFRELGFSVRLSPFSDRRIYELGAPSSPSESACYPSKLSFGHVKWLIESGIDTVFYPCVFYEKKEYEHAQDHYNCPLVIGSPQNVYIDPSVSSDRQARILRPFLSFTDFDILTKQLETFCRKEWDIPAYSVRKAVRAGWDQLLRVKKEISDRGQRMIAEMTDRGLKGIVLAGRPYHIDPEISHLIPEMIASYGYYVFTEDCLPSVGYNENAVFGGDLWVYHSRLYNAARFVSARKDLELIQLNSFGCGLDAVTKDTLRSILEDNGKSYTVLRIDEINDLAAARVRVRSLFAAMERR